MDTGIPMVGKHAETHRNKVLKRYRSIVDAWYWTSPAGWKWMIFWGTENNRYIDLVGGLEHEFYFP